MLKTRLVVMFFFEVYKTCVDIFGILTRFFYLK